LTDRWDAVVAVNPGAYYEFKVVAIARDGDQNSADATLKGAAVEPGVFITVVEDENNLGDEDDISYHTLAVGEKVAAPTGFVVTNKTKVGTAWTYDFAWTPAATAPGTAEYVLEYKTGAGAWTRTNVTVSGNTATVTGLADGELYDFHVVASAIGYAANDSVEKMNLKIEASTFSAPGAPVPENKWVEGSTWSQELEWAPVTTTTTVGDDPVVAAVVQYQVFAKSDDDGAEYVPKTTVSGTSAVITGLEDGKTYTFYIVAVPVAGDSGFVKSGNSPESVGAKMATADLTKPALTVDQVKGDVVLSWGLVANAGTYVVEYRAVVTDQGAEDGWGTANITMAGSSAAISGLAPGEYEFRVKAFPPSPSGYTGSFIVETFEVLATP
jgi:hypothetical protein